MKQVFFLFAAFFVFINPASAQGYHVPGSYPESPAIRNAGGAENARAIAEAKGWQPYQLPADTPLRMRDAGGGWTGQRIMPRGTWMGATSSGSVHVIGYVDASGVWRGCGNLTDLRIIVHTRVVEREVTREVPVQNTVYVFGPTVYPTAPMPQPSVQYTARPPVYANWNFSGVNIKSPGNTTNSSTNLFNGQSSFNANANENTSENFNLNAAEGGAGGSVGDITSQNNNASTSQSQNVDPDTTVVNTGAGNADGSSFGTGFQGGATDQGNLRR